MALPDISVYGVVYDLNGTLTNDLGMMEEAVRTAAASQGLKVSEKDFEGLLKYPLGLAGSGMKQEECERLERQARENFSRLIKEHVSSGKQLASPNAKNALARLGVEGYHVLVHSQMGTDEVEKTLIASGLIKFVDNYSGAPNGKSTSSFYELCSSIDTINPRTKKRESLKPYNFVLVTDSYIDITAGRDAGFRAIVAYEPNKTSRKRASVPWACENLKEEDIPPILLAETADHKIKDHMEIFPILKQLKNEDLRYFSAIKGAELSLSW